MEEKKKKPEMLYWNIAGKGITGRTEVRLRAVVRNLVQRKRRGEKGTDSGEMAKLKQKKRENLNFSFFCSQ